MTRWLLEKKRRPTALIAVAGLLLAWYWSRQSGLPMFDTAPDLDREEPNAFLEGSVWTQFDRDGQVRTRLQTDKAFHFPESSEAQLTSPRLQLYRDGEPTPWEATARRGIYSVDTKAVQLSGFVTVTGKDVTNRSLRLDTPALTYMASDGYIRTDQPVTIHSGFNQLTAVGMEIEVETSVVRLQSQVEGFYVNP